MQRVTESRRCELLAEPVLAHLAGFVGNHHLLSHDVRDNDSDAVHGRQAVGDLPRALITEHPSSGDDGLDDRVACVALPDTEVEPEK